MKGVPSPDCIHRLLSLLGCCCNSDGIFMDNQNSHRSNTILKEPVDFSLVLGGFLFQFFIRAHLSGTALQLLGRRIVFLVALAWIPLLILTAAQGNALPGSIQLPFLHDIELHIRLLVAMPILIGAELLVHKRMRSVVGTFVERRLIPPEAMHQFEAVIASAVRWRNSALSELLLLVAVYVIGILFIWRTQVSLEIDSWYGTVSDDVFHHSWAGWWLILISLPIFQFLLLRWYFRMFIWGRFLWQVSRIKLNLLFSNPDRCGGLGFLSQIIYAFAPILFGQGVLLAGMICDRVFYAGAKLTDFQFEIVGLIVLEMIFILGPLMVFSPQLIETKRIGLLEFGNMTHRAVHDFHMRWLTPKQPGEQSLLDPPDIQSLSNLGTSYEYMKQLSWIPFTLQNVLQLAILGLLPISPLLLSMFSVEELLGKLIKILF